MTYMKLLLQKAYALKANKKSLVAALLFLLWALLLHLALIKISGKDNSKAVIASFTFFLGLISLFKLCKVTDNPILKILFWITTLFTALFYSIITMAFSYAYKTKVPISASDINTLFQTNISELIEFLANSFFTTRLTILFILVFLSTVFIYKFLYASLKSLNISFKFRIFYISIAILLLCFGFSTFRTTTNIIKLKETYDASIKEYKALKEKYNEAKPVVYNAQKTNTGELYVIVIGEAASRDRMHLYGAPSNTTPWLDSVVNEDGWTVLKNAYSPHTHTVPSLISCLGEKNVYSTKKFSEMSTIISLSRSLNFKTVWISNQIQQGLFDNPISILGETSDISIFANNAKSIDLTVIPPDEILIPIFANQLKNLNFEQNNLVIVHLFGSHGKYKQRYPDSFNEIKGISTSSIGKMFANKDKTEKLSTYETSILYTDSILKKIFEITQQSNNQPTVFIYFSDHGEDPTGNNHQSSDFTWTMARIPLLVWMSDEYQKLYPERASNLKTNSDKLYTNDLFFNLFTGLANIEYENNTPQFDISSKDYNLPIEQATIVDGKYHIADDPMLTTSKNIKNFASSNGPLAVHRSNSTFKQSEAIHLGASRLEIDIVLTQEDNRLLIGHDEKVMSDTDLGTFLANRSKDVSYLWLDMKNLSSETAPEIFTQMTALDQKYNLKNRCLIETGYFDGGILFAKAGWKTSYYLQWESLSEAYEKNDLDALHGLAKEIAAVVKNNNFASISYDLAADAAVIESLYPLLGDSVEYNAWKTQWNFNDPDLENKIAKYPHLKTLLIRLDSLFYL